MLYKILWKIMGALYGHNLGCDEPPSETQMVTQIFQLEQELNDWQNQLPPELHLQSSSNLPDESNLDDPVLERFRVILSMRYLNTQLLLHRPCLTKSLGGLTGDSHPPLQRQRSTSQLQTNFNRACVQAAEDSIAILYAVLTKPGLGSQLIGAWWFTLYYGK